MVAQPDDPVLRVCRTCGEAKPLTAEFWHAGPAYRGGFVPHCKVCVNRRHAAHKAEQRVQRGGKPKRRPRSVDGVEEWECKTAGCGWHARSEFYLNKRGTPRPLCKSCHKRVSTENQRTEAARQRIAQNEQRRQRERDPAGWSAKEQRVAERAARRTRGVRLCPGCQQEWPFVEFQPTEERPTGKRARCQKCRNRQSVEYREALRAADPVGYSERIRRQGQNPATRDRQREWKRRKAREMGVQPRQPAISRDERLARRRAYYAENAELLRATEAERQKRRRRAKPEEVRAYERERRRKRRLADPEAARDKGRRDFHRRRALLLDADVRAVTARDLHRLHVRQDGRCFYCHRARKLTLEHVIPLSRGGRHAIGNFVLACEPCNKGKGPLLLVEWRHRGLFPV